MKLAWTRRATRATGTPSARRSATQRCADGHVRFERHATRALALLRTITTHHATPRYKPRLLPKLSQVTPHRAHLDREITTDDHDAQSIIHPNPSSPPAPVRVPSITSSTRRPRIYGAQHANSTTSFDMRYVRRGAVWRPRCVTSRLLHPTTCASAAPMRSAHKRRASAAATPRTAPQCNIPSHARRRHDAERHEGRLHRAPHGHRRQ